MTHQNKYSSNDRSKTRQSLEYSTVESYLNTLIKPLRPLSFSLKRSAKRLKILLHCLLCLLVCRSIPSLDSLFQRNMIRIEFQNSSPLIL